MVDVIDDVECGVGYLGIEYASRADVVAAFPTATVATDSKAFIVERPPTEPAATWRVNAVKFGEPGK